MKNSIEEDKLSKAIDLLISEVKIYDQYYCLATSQALKTVLNELDRLKKENEKLKEQVNMFDEAYSGAIKESKKWFDIAHDSIPKQVIQYKIEELKQEKKKYGNCLIEMYEDELVNRDIKILQELLESEE